ncbi:MAG: AAA family ATPase, partial [Actinobacteria bacterium]|nr:AAA family ATPase [Actinomycetota bacterium]
MIMVRVQAGLPVVVMGESGCGKTALITYLTTLLGEELEVFNIHSGVTVSDIRRKMTEVSEKARSKRVWVFFDEFNTTPFVSLIAEIICDRIFDGLPISPNLVLLAACNPYRVKRTAVKASRKVGLQLKSANHLQHIVHPLPDSVIEYVWDYGALQGNDLFSYVQCILRNEGLPNTHCHPRQSNFAWFVYTAHSLIDRIWEKNTVSLRDVRRCAKLYHWFIKSTAIKVQFPPALQPEYLEIRQPSEETALLLAVYMCYILRVSQQATRERVVKELADTFPLARDIVAVVRREQLDLLARLDIASSVAQNEALRENVFALFTCIYNNIPALLCGKPGCSKSLAYQ